MSRSHSLKIPLLGPLATVLPSREQTQLLRACLWSGEPGAQAWREWSRNIADPARFLRQENDGVKGLLSLLFDSLQNNGVFVKGEFGTYLRTAYLRDKLRSRRYGEICHNVITAFTNVGIPAVLLKGAGLAETCYESPALQHAHYLEILINDGDVHCAVDTLHAHEFTRFSSGVVSERQGIELVHQSGLPLVLHRNLFRFPFYAVRMEEVWARSRVDIVYGTPTRLLCPSDNLFHICGAVFDIERCDPLRWVCDAWFLIRRFPTLDWNLVLERAVQSRMVLPLFMTTSYLAGSLKAPIPSVFLAELHSAVAKAQATEREASLFAVQTNARGGLKKIIQSSDDWPTRAFVLKWALLPSSDYMRYIYQISSVFLLPLYYLHRPIRYLLRSVWFCIRRVLRRVCERFEVLCNVP